MLILNQEKDTVYNISSMIYIEIFENEISFETEGISKTIAEYKTEEQAKAAFNDFLNFYSTISVNKNDNADAEISVEKVAAMFEIKDHSVYAFPTQEEIEERIKQQQGEKND